MPVIARASPREHSASLEKHNGGVMGRFGSVKGQVPANADRTFPPNPLTRAEADALISTALAEPRMGLRNGAMLAVMYRGGLRVSEVLALRGADVDTDRGTVSVLHGKGDKFRVCHIGQAASALVGRWKLERIRLGAAAGPLFCTAVGGPVSDRYVRMMMHRLGRKAGVGKRVTPHQLRHSHASELVWAGTPVNVISKQLGHSSSAVTARYLDHITNHDVAMWVARLEWEVPA
jgi:site-specific recombinase XerD